MLPNILPQFSKTPNDGLKPGYDISFNKNGIIGPN
jgi:hypothetical protein